MLSAKIIKISPGSFTISGEQSNGTRELNPVLVRANTNTYIIYGDWRLFISSSLIKTNIYYISRSDDSSTQDQITSILFVCHHQNDRMFCKSSYFVNLYWLESKHELMRI